MAQIDCELYETQTATEEASEASDDDYEECDAQEDNEECDAQEGNEECDAQEDNEECDAQEDNEECDAQEEGEEYDAQVDNESSDYGDECDEEAMNGSSKIIDKSTYTGKFYDEFDRKRREFQMQTKGDRGCPDTGRLPLDYSELMNLDIILSEHRNRLTWAMYLLNYTKPIYDIVQLEEIYNDFISAFDDRDTIYNMAVEIGGCDERWLNIVKQLKDHSLRKVDIEEIYVNYNSRKHKGIQLPDEDDPLINGFKFDNYEYLIKKD